MKIELIRIGNSQGIRIPKPVIEQCGFRGTVEMRVEDRSLVISSARKPRDSWEGSFADMAAQSDDEMLLGDDGGSWDDEEWTW